MIKAATPVKRILALLAGAALFLGMLFYVGPGRVVAAVKQASPVWLVLSIVSYALFFVLRGWRWRVLLSRSAAGVSIGSAASISAVGWLANPFLPLKGCDVLRAALMTKREGVPGGTSAASVGLERVLGLVGAAMNRKGVYITQGIAAYRRVRDAMRDPRVDVIHYHVSIPGMAAWAALARARTRCEKPLILHMWNPWYDARDMHAPAPGSEGLYQRAFNAPATTLPFLRAFDSIVVSSECYQPAPQASTRTNARRELGLPVDATLLLYYGHLTPWKGVRVLVDALPKAFEEDPDAHLVIARTHYGRDEQAIRARLRELAVHRRVTFLGICDVPLLLQAVDSGVVPATAAVGTACHPNVVLEYMAAGVPVVASRVGSIPEAVIDERTGLLATPGDAADLGAKLQRLVSDASLRRRLGLAARARAEAAFDWRGIAERYEQVLTGSLANGRAQERRTTSRSPFVRRVRA